MTKETGPDLEQILAAGRRSRLRRTVVASTLGVAAISVGVVFFLKWKHGTESLDAPVYVTEKIEQGDLTAGISATGTVEALNTVEVGAEISGRILSLHADFNDGVTTGQLLARIDPEQHRATVDQAKAQMLAARAQVAEAGATLKESTREAERAKELAQKGLLSDRELESAEAKAVRADASLKSAEASFALAKASFDAARTKLDRTEIVSPISGTVLSREVEVGQTLNAGMQTPVLFTIAEDLRRMQLSSRVDEADIGRVAVGQAASFTVDAHPGKTFSSLVTAVRNVPLTEQNVVSYEVLLQVDNDQLLLKPGMTASVEIVTEQLSDVLLVSNRALRFAPPRESAFRRPPGGGVPYLRKADGKQKSRPDADPAAALGRLKANEGLLWVEDRSTPGGLRPRKVVRLATDGEKTAIASTELSAGDEVVVEQTDAAAAP